MSDKLPTHLPLNFPNTLSHISQCPPRQDSVTEQLRDLIKVANKLGMYDAADFVSNRLKERG